MTSTKSKQVISDIMFSIFDRFSPEKLKPHLKMAVNRFGILNSKKAAMIRKEKREIATLLSNEKEEKARIKVEHIIRSDFTIEANEILELLCELLHERMKLLVAEEKCPSDLDEAVCTLIYCANRTECPELTEITKQLKMKYGKEFYERASDNVGGCVNERVVHKLSIQPPTAYLIQQYLMSIAEEYEVPWTPTDLGVTDEDMMSTAAPAPRGFSVPVGGGSGIQAPYFAQAASQEEASFPPTPSQPPQQRQTQPAPSAQTSTDNSFGFNEGYKAGFSAANSLNRGSGGGGGGDVPVAKVVGTSNKEVVLVEAEIEEVGAQIDPLPSLPILPPVPAKVNHPIPSAPPNENSAEVFDLPEVPQQQPQSLQEFDIPEAPPAARDSRGMSFEDMQARLNGLSGSSVSPVDETSSSSSSGPPPSDYDSLMNRFNSLKN